MTETWDGASPLLFLAGAAIFLGSVVLFGYDLFANNDPFRGIVANAVGGGMLIAWAALDTLQDPNSEVDSRGGAVGTALLLYGIYLLLGGVTVAATGLFFHERGAIGLWYVGLAVGSIIVGFLIFPTESVVEAEKDTDSLTEEGGQSQADEPDTSPGRDTKSDN